MRCWRCQSKVKDTAPACRSCGAAIIRGDQPTQLEVALTLVGAGAASPWAARPTSHWAAWTRIMGILALVVSPLLFGLLGTWTVRRAERAREPGASAARSVLHACVFAGFALNALALVYLRTR